MTDDLFDYARHQRRAQRIARGEPLGPETHPDMVNRSMAVGAYLRGDELRNYRPQAVRAGDGKEQD